MLQNYAAAVSISHKDHHHAERHDENLHQLKKKGFRKRVSAIQAPSDLWVDNKRDEILQLYETNPRVDATRAFCPRYLFRTSELFDDALELYNRLHFCKAPNGLWEAGQVFVQRKGAARVSCKMCTKCGDGRKLVTKTDVYYMNILERSMQRTILCHSCTGKLLKERIGEDPRSIRDKLQKLRAAQKGKLRPPCYP